MADIIGHAHAARDDLKNQTPQIVLLGAGYDSRAFRFAGSNRGAKIFELDIASTQERYMWRLFPDRLRPQDHKFNCH